MVIGIDTLDVATGDQYEFFAFYFIPVGLVAWHLGMTWGLVFALASTIAWFDSDVIANPLHPILLTGWDTLMRMIGYTLLAITTAKIHTVLRKEQQLNDNLAQALSEIKQLQGVLPMCSFCRKIRDDQQEWIPFEKYIKEHSNAEVSHGLCPTCYKKYYGEPDGT